MMVFHSTIHTTPYEALYDQAQPQHMTYLVGASSVASVDKSLQYREAAMKLLQFHFNTSLEQNEAIGKSTQK